MHPGCWGRVNLDPECWGRVPGTLQPGTGLLGMHPATWEIYTWIRWSCCNISRDVAGNVLQWFRLAGGLAAEL